MLSSFHISVGFYFSALMIILAVYVLILGQLYFALSGVETAANANSIGDKKSCKCYFVLMLLVLHYMFTSFRFMDIFTSLLANVPTGWGMLCCPSVSPRSSVVALALLYDLMFGVIVMAPVVFLSWMPGFQFMQTRILFNDAFCRGLRMFQLLIIMIR